MIHIYWINILLCHKKKIFICNVLKNMLGKISIVGYDTVLYQRISLALWNLIMATSIDYTERCHIVLVRSLCSTRSLAVSTIVNSHLLILGHIAPPDTSQLSTSLVCCSFFVLDVTCNPRGITVHMIFFKPKSIIYLNIKSRSWGLIIDH